MTTQTQTKAAIRRIDPRLTVRVLDDEIRVSVSIAALQEIFSYTYKEALARNESLAAYCYDSDEALANARCMVAWLRSEEGLRA